MFFFFCIVKIEVKPAVAAVIHCDVSEMGSWMHPDVGRKCKPPLQIDTLHRLIRDCWNNLFVHLNSWVFAFMRFFDCTSVFISSFCACHLSTTALHVTAKTMRLRMRKASQQSNPTLESRPSRTKRRHSEVEEDTPPTSGGRGLFSTIKKFIRGNAVKVTTSSHHIQWQWLQHT